LFVARSPPLRTQQWPGKHHFFRHGRWLVARKWHGALGTLLLVSEPSGLFLGLVAPRLDAPLSWVSCVMVALLAAAVIALLLQTCLTDLGVLPRFEPDRDLDKPR